MKSVLSHLNEHGEARMVDVGHKIKTVRTAWAEARVYMNIETLQLLQSGELKKGDAFTVAKIAGIQAAKKTSDLIPMCHPISLDHIEINFKEDASNSCVIIESKVSTTAKTGVEMEALSAVTVAALTLYDMAKSSDPHMRICDVKVIQKKGGSHDYSIQSRSCNGE